jgi:hypothetical protein
MAAATALYQAAQRPIGHPLHEGSQSGAGVFQPVIVTGHQIDKRLPAVIDKRITRFESIRGVM